MGAAAIPGAEPVLLSLQTHRRAANRRRKGRRQASVPVGTSAPFPARMQARPRTVKHLTAFISMVKWCAGVGAGIGGGGWRLQVARADSWVT